MNASEHPSFTVRISGLRKAYGDRTVVDIDGLSLESDFVYALIGPNGSGKSTLLRMLAGVIDPTEGTVEVSGGRKRDELRVGYMPQRAYAFGFSVFRNVAIALRGQGLPKDEVNRRVKGALKAVGMEDMTDAKGGGLSGGEAQRVALARILACDLDVVLLDEPTASMDMSGTMLVEQALADYRKRTGCLIVIATHAPAQARRVSGQAAMLSSGRVVECGPTSDVLLHPTSPEGSSFLAYWSLQEL